MKKKYMVPKSQAIGINLEGMIAASGDKTEIPRNDNNTFYDEGQVLSDRSGWSSDNWNE